MSLPRSPVNPKPCAPSQGPPARVLSPLFFQAKSLLLPKPCGKREHPKVMWSFLVKATGSPFCQSHVILPWVWLLHLGFKSQRQSSSAAPFLSPPTISYTCQLSRIHPLYWAAIVSLGRCGPMAWSQSSPSSHTGAGSVTRGSCLLVTSWVEVTSIPLAQSMATAI